MFDILLTDIGMILPKFEDKETSQKWRRHKRQIISALIGGFIGLAYEGISNFLHYK